MKEYSKNKKMSHDNIIDDLKIPTDEYTKTEVKVTQRRYKIVHND